MWNACGGNACWGISGSCVPFSAELVCGVGGGFVCPPGPMVTIGGGFVCPPGPMGPGGGGFVCPPGPMGPGGGGPVCPPGPMGPGGGGSVCPPGPMGPGGGGPVCPPGPTSERNYNWGNTGIYTGGNSSGGSISGTTGYITFSGAPGSGSKSTVANATGKSIKIIFHSKEIKLEDVLGKAEAGTKRVFKIENDTAFINLLSNSQFEGPSFKEGLASIFVADGEVYVETISLNYQVPFGACWIVTANKEIKFRKSDGGIWVDEDDHDHSPK